MPVDNFGLLPGGLGHLVKWHQYKANGLVYPTLQLLLAADCQTLAWQLVWYNKNILGPKAYGAIGL